ncbi:hypothetical protein BOX15_Mlig028516g5 [Macrostomum lignano]|uniref:Leptin receptor overlapping transcript-like 1 n=2 Tax=Macrostomum lignano TaxID=282301 RepID=A0A267G738_9PLAT|nr:hypothetical protein BOX15_Mlig028516g5 [Macrostomum lignano]
MGAGVKGIILLSFSASVGLTFLLLACALPQYGMWWPMFVLIFYLLAPVPYLLAKRISDSTSTSGVAWETAIFLTSVLVVSAYGLPIVLAHTPIGKPAIQWGACALVLSGNTVMFLTILGFFLVFRDNDGFSYSAW